MVYDKNGHLIHESSFKSKADRNFKPEGFIQLPQAVLINDIIHSNEKLPDPFLKDIRNEYKSKKYDGYNIYSFSNETECMAVLIISSKFPDGSKCVDLILIKEKYRGYGLSKQLLDFAVSEGAYWLTVYEDNEIAKRAYESYGFITNYIDLKNSIRVMILKSKARKFSVSEDLKNNDGPLPRKFIEHYWNLKPSKTRHILYLWDHVAFIVEYKKDKTVNIRVYDNLINVAPIMSELLDLIDTFYYPVRGYSWECM